MTAAPFTVGTLIAGKYKLLKLLGEGGMGAVYLAENLDIGRQVALKVLHARLGRDDAVMSRFRQEARAAAAVDHPGIVGVLDMGQAESGEPFIVMERLDGETLGARIKQRGKLSVDETRSVMIEVLDALAAAHAKGIIHRDLKPDNLFLVWRPRWAVKILDFGISRLANPDEVRITETNQTMGSVLYMPPEQARDARSAGPAADLYAVGATMFHALAGRPPFDGGNYTEVLSKVLSEDAEPLARAAPGVPPELARLVDALLQKEPAARPQSAAAVRDQLRALGGDVAPLAAPRSAEAAAAGPIDVMGETAATPPPGRADALGATAPSAPPARADAMAATAATPPPGPAASIAAPAERPALGATAATGAPAPAEIPPLAATAAPVEATHATPRRRGLFVAAGVVLVAIAAGGTYLAIRSSSSPAAAHDAAIASPHDAASTPALDAEATVPHAADAAVTAPADAAIAAPADARMPVERGHGPVVRPPRPVIDAAVPVPDAKPDAQGSALSHLPFAPTEGNE